MRFDHAYEAAGRYHLGSNIQEFSSFVLHLPFLFLLDIKRWQWFDRIAHTFLAWLW